jgi:uncharacterized protein YdhG (YjbR/CyaY superfamily)
MASTKDGKKDGSSQVLAKIAEMTDKDRVVAERLHEVITSAAPELAPRLWYSQPAYAKDGKVVCFFRGADVDGERYVSLGFSGSANLDDGNVWATSFAVTKVTDADAKKIAALVRKAVS